MNKLMSDIALQAKHLDFEVSQCDRYRMFAVLMQLQRFFRYIDAIRRRVALL